jgi:hypothetical protein
MQAPRIAAMGGGVARQPAKRHADMGDDVGHAHLRDQRIVEYRDQRAARREGAADEGEGRGVERAPEPAMDEDQHGRRPRLGGRQEQVQRRLRPLAVAQPRHMRAGDARARRQFQPPRHDRRQVADPVEAELGVEARLVWIMSPQHRPIAPRSCTRAQFRGARELAQ